MYKTIETLYLQEFNIDASISFESKILFFYLKGDQMRRIGWNITIEYKFQWKFNYLMLSNLVNVENHEL